MVNRRNFVRWGIGSGFVALIPACGGSDDGLDEVVIDSGQIGELSSLPDPVFLRHEELHKELPFALEAQVLLGRVPQANATVNFFDIHGALIASGVTDSQGLCRVATLAREFVCVQAVTSAGVLHGMRLHHGLPQNAGIEVNLYQTLAAQLADRLKVEFNVLNYILQDYFHLNYHDYIWGVGVDHPRFSQERMAQELFASGKSLDEYVSSLVDDIVENIDNDAYVNLRFKREKANDLLLQNDLASYEEDVLDLGIDLMEHFFQNFAQFPGSSILYNFFFKLIRDGTGAPRENPLLDVSRALFRIDEKLDQIKLELKKLNLTMVLLALEENWAQFSSRESLLTNQDVAESDLDQITEWLLTTEALQLLEKSHFIFFGTDGRDSKASVIGPLVEISSAQQFFSIDAQAGYRAMLARFLLVQGKCYGMILAAADDAEKLGTHSSVIASRRRLCLGKMELIKRNIGLLKGHTLPKQMFIDAKAKLAWVGSCNDVVDPREFLRSDVVWAGHPRFPAEVKYGLGTLDGVDNEKFMLDVGYHEHGVNRNTIKNDIFKPNWRLPSVDELRAAFYDRCKKSGKKLDVVAFENGVSSYSHFTRVGDDQRMVTVVTDSINKEYVKYNEKSAWFGEDFYVNTLGRVNLVRFSSNEIASVEIGSIYKVHKHVYAYFPVTDISPDVLNETIPAMIYKKQKENIK